MTNRKAVEIYFISYNKKITLFFNLNHYIMNMKIFIIIFCLMFFSSSQSSSQSFHDFKIESITGETIDLKDYKNKVVLLVNTASKCGFTPQYSGLQKLLINIKMMVLQF